MKNKVGRPQMPLEQRKVLVHIRLSPEVLSALKATGPGWQTRINALLTEHVRQQHETGINPPPP